MTEAETRKKLIDEKLRLSGWNPSDATQVARELEIEIHSPDGLTAAEPTPDYGAEHQYADYALLLHGQPVAVVEAKRTSKDAALGREQALQYAANIQKSHGGELPFVLYTNGYEIFFWEHGFYPPTKVHGFPTRDDLEWMVERRRQRRSLSVELIDTRIVGRDYQIAAIRSLLEGIEKKRRKFLLVMATGTGKTRTATALIDVLSRARWAKRILFLVDRVALRDQALDAFEEHIPAEPRWPQKQGGSVETVFARNRRLYVTTYPTMLNLIHAGTKPESWISPHFFDVVIADESHRSIYNTYRQILDYFHAVKIGLTATPTKHIDHDTFHLFECDAHDPTFAYTFEEAIEHRPPYLSDFEVLKVRSKFQLEGIKGETLAEAVKKKLVAEGIDPEDIDFEGTDLERKVTNAGTNALIVREFMEESIKDPTGTLPGKTIFFAISKGHARRLEELFDKLYPEYAGRLARVLVSNDPRVYGKGGLLDQFKTQDMPRVAISVDMLDTGVDVPEVVNLVFAKPVYSYTKFWQMIGRGTRVLDGNPAKLKPWCPTKDKFLVIDCWGNFDFFKMKPKGREPAEQVALPVQLFVARLDHLEAALAKSDADAIERAKDDLRSDLAELPKNNVVVAEAEAKLAEVQPDTFWQQLRAEDLGFLRARIAPVMRARSAADDKRLRFEKTVVEARTAHLAGNKERFEAARAAVVEQVDELPLSVNVVVKEKALIEQVLTDAWWQAVTGDRLCGASERLGPLMRFRQQRREGLLHLDLEDLTAIKETVEFGPAHERLSTHAYRDRIEAAIRALIENNLVLQKLQIGEAVSDAEIRQLADVLASQDPWVTEELLRKVYDHKTARFIQFIKHILGLEPLASWEETVTSAFDGFIAQHNTFSAMQIQFLQTLKTFILQTGKVERRHLIVAPFTQIHPQGIRGVFRPEQIAEILSFTERLVA